MSAVLADIGGTHARFARLDQGGPSGMEKYPVADFPTFEDALRHYAGTAGGTLYMATAAWPHADGIWRFARDGRWEISLPALERSGWHIGWIGNDFAASARGAAALGPGGLYGVQDGIPGDTPRGRCAVLGSGTGLGLAYVEGDHVQETYGGHMDIPHRTDEQNSIVKLAGRIKDNERPISAEDLIRGPGLALLHGAVSLVHGRKGDKATPEDILANRALFPFSDTLRLYHEFLGLFAHQAAIYGHAFAGLYLDGGVLHRLIESGAFDKAAFLNSFIGDPLPLIKRRLETMKISIVTDPFVALHGLAEIVKTKDKAHAS